MENDPDMWRINEAFLNKRLKLNDYVEFNFAAPYTLCFVVQKIGEMQLKHRWLTRFRKKYSAKVYQFATGKVTGMNMKTMEFFYEKD